METIKFSSAKDRDKALEYIFGKQVIQVLSRNTIAVSRGTANRLRNKYGIQLKVIETSKKLLPV